MLHSARGESRTRTRLPSADFESDGLARPRDTSGITVRQDNGLGPGGLPIDDGWCRVVRGTFGAQRPVMDGSGEWRARREHPCGLRLTDGRRTIPPHVEDPTVLRVQSVARSSPPRTTNPARDKPVGSVVPTTGTGPAHARTARHGDHDSGGGIGEAGGRPTDLHRIGAVRGGGGRLDAQCCRGTGGAHRGD